MFRTWREFDQTFAALDELRRELESAFPWDRGRRAPRALASWPQVNIDDTGAALVITADVPGMTADELELNLNQDTLTISGARKTSAPEGYSVHRRERGSFQFSRSFALPAKVDPEKTSAAVRDGVLSITLEKAAEARPRQIAVKNA